MSLQALDVSVLRPGFDAILKAGDDVPSVMMTLVVLNADAKEKGLPAPQYNLCQLLVLQKTTFCQFNKGLDRISMPQLIGKPTPGGKAEQMFKDGTAKLDALTGEVDLQNEFKKFLKSRGGVITNKQVDAFTLKATQSELVGSKVAGMWFALKQNPENPAIKEPIFVSSDNYILDGHHRWAAINATKFGLGRMKEVTMPVMMINKDINQLLALANQFLKEYGIQAKSGA